MEPTAGSTRERRHEAIEKARAAIASARRVRLRPGCSVLAASLQEALEQRDSFPSTVA